MEHNWSWIPTTVGILQDASDQCSGFRDGCLWDHLPRSSNQGSNLLDPILYHDNGEDKFHIIYHYTFGCPIYYPYKDPACLEAPEPWSPSPPFRFFPLRVFPAADVSTLPIAPANVCIPEAPARPWSDRCCLPSKHPPAWVKQGDGWLLKKN